MSSSNSSYNPAEETINSILTGLLPVLIVGLFNGFEDGKKKKLSVINIFDDFVIFASIVIYPLITAIEWYQYYSNYYKKTVIINYTFIAFFGIISYIYFLLVQYINEENEKNEEENNENVSSVEEEKKIDKRGSNEISINVDNENGNNKNEENEKNEEENNENVLSLVEEEKKIDKRGSDEININVDNENGNNKNEENEKNEEENNENVSSVEEEKKIDEIGSDEISKNVDNENGNNKNEENDEKINGREIIKIIIKALFERSINEIQLLACYFIFVLTISTYFGYDAFIHGDHNLSFGFNNPNKVYNHMSSYCIENFGVNKCNSLRLTNIIIYFAGIVFYVLHGLYISILRIRKLREGKLGRYLENFKHIDQFTTILNVFKHINIVLLIVYPAIVSGYLISTSPITTKIAFGICTLSFTRLVDHFNEKPDKINTLISIYLNGEGNSKDKEQIDKLAEEIEKLTNKINNQTNVIYNLRNEIKENKLNKVENVN
ncbi:unnamed protein product [Rhizophagus irregularis]|nr:unnamed protein product [Rhizophagus irregularis]